MDQIINAALCNIQKYESIEKIMLRKLVHCSWATKGRIRWQLDPSSLFNVLLGVRSNFFVVSHSLAIYLVIIKIIIMTEIWTNNNIVRKWTHFAASSLRHPFKVCLKWLTGSFPTHVIIGQCILMVFIHWRVISVFQE